jgi:DNA-binding NarL/FixJ family response regulator
MPEIDGLTLIRELKNDFPKIRIIILSMHDNEKYIMEAFREGASGYLFKNVSPDELLFTIKHIHSGSKHLCSELTMKLIDKLVHVNEDQNLSPSLEIDFSLREIEILNLIADGMTNAEIADKLFISKRTIEGYRQGLIEKTGVRNTPSLIKYAILNGVIK